jgi:hypothetical protein
MHGCSITYGMVRWYGTLQDRTVDTVQSWSWYRVCAVCTKYCTVHGWEHSRRSSSISVDTGRLERWIMLHSVVRDVGFSTACGAMSIHPLDCCSLLGLRNVVQQPCQADIRVGHGSTASCVAAFLHDSIPGAGGTTIPKEDKRPSASGYTSPVYGVRRYVSPYGGTPTVRRTSVLRTYSVLVERCTP